MGEERREQNEKGRERVKGMDGLEGERERVLLCKNECALVVISLAFYFNGLS